MSLDDEKRRLRTQARAARKAAAAATPDAGPRIAGHVVDALRVMGVAPPAVVAAYWPLGDEVDARPLLNALDGLGFVCALPVVVSPDATLVFRRWRPHMDLEAGDHGTRQPGADSPAVTPAVVVAPLLAFDRDGTRLGRGGGFYDHTLAVLRAGGSVIAVGIAYEAQRVRRVPRAAWDQRLDWVVTEDGAWDVRSGS